MSYSLLALYVKRLAVIILYGLIFSLLKFEERNLFPTRLKSSEAILQLQKRYIFFKILPRAPPISKTFKEVLFLIKLVFR